MVTVGLYYDVFPEKSSLFVERFREVLALLKTTPGHASSFLYQRVDDPYSYAILSEWEDRESFLAFLRSDAFRTTADWGKAGVLRSAPRHKVYPRSEDLGR